MRFLPLFLSVFVSLILASSVVSGQEPDENLRSTALLDAPESIRQTTELAPRNPEALYEIIDGNELLLPTKSVESAVLSTRWFNSSRGGTDYRISMAIFALSE
jgi:hypothetical protein